MNQHGGRKPDFGKGDLVEFVGNRYVLGDCGSHHVEAWPAKKDGSIDHRKGRQIIPASDCRLIDRASLHVKIPDPLPCPCCGESRRYGSDRNGNTHGLDVGIRSNMVGGIRCCRCGLKMEREWPDKYPRGVVDSEGMYAYATKVAVEAWNSRKAVESRPGHPTRKGQPK